MSSVRREKTRREFGFDSEKEIEEIEEEKKKAHVRKEKKDVRRRQIESSFLYRVLIKGAVGFDIADALLGFLEVGGDFLSGIMGILYVFLSIAVVRSFKLTIAVFAVTMVDFLLGLIPIAGSFADTIFCGNYINRSLIKGYVEGDNRINKKINLIAIGGLIVSSLLVFLIVKLVGSFL